MAMTIPEIKDYIRFRLIDVPAGLAPKDDKVKVVRDLLTEEDVRAIANELKVSAAYMRAERRWAFSNKQFNTQTHGWSCRVIV